MLKNSQNVPDGWKIKRLGDICSTFSGGTPSKSNEEFWNGNIKWLSAKYIEDDVVTGWDYITQKGLENSSSKLSNIDDLILVTRVSVGKMFLAKENFAVNQDLTILRPLDINSKFFFYLVKMKTSEIKDKSQGLAIKGITKEELNNILVYFPPLSEQKRIATVLSLWDKGIEEISKVIAFKEQQKKGLMQRLLTGKTRLPGFTQPWKEVKLGDIGNTYTGLSGKTKVDFGSGAPFITYMNIFLSNKISKNRMDYVNLNQMEKQNSVKYGDIFFTTSSETPEEVGMASVLLFEPEIKTYLNSFCFGFRMDNFKILLPEFAAYYLRSSHIRSHLSILAQGVTRFNLSKNELMKLHINIPSDIKEQSAIATILTEADNEINLLKQKLELFKQQKKWLMQQLLTGKKRLAC